ncbi:MAG: hypothetical protein HYW07_21900 [Candidatus Latescibacteria bacterium]|nr:hypothetical protein [Candidatus Latescibacterota bacterium]
MGRALSLALVLALWWGTVAGAQTDYGNRLGRQVGDRSLYSAVGTAVQIRSLDPTVQRWYLPQELFQEYGRKQWRYTNYAEEYFRRYLERSQEGSYFYDFYGDLVTRGWLIYNWRQTQPLAFESSAITKDSRYVNWFDRLILSSDASGDYSYTIMVGDEINTTLTPMTFRKAGFNGVATSLATPRVRATALFSRVTLPIIDVDPEIPTVSVENSTNLSAGRIETDVNDFLTLGLTMVNAHNINGARESFRDNPFKGLLTSGQLDRRLNLLVVRLSDDSPEDEEGGAVLFSENVEITTTLRRQVQVGDSLQMVPRDTVITGSSLGFRGVREGGKLRKGFLTADGPESIALKYILSPESGEGEEGTLRLLLQQGLGLSLAEAEDAVSAIKNVRFRLVLANDYRVEVASDRQTNPVGQPQFLVVSRAPGNIKNHLNQREVVFDYGLPTASQLYGLSAELRDFRGFDLYGEFNVNTQYRKYPTTIAKKHRSIAGIGGDRHAVGWMANLSRRAGPWRFFLEGFGMDEGYTTSILPVDGRGVADYSPEATSRLYDLVDDNDDNDRHPDQQRIFQGSLIRIPGQDFKIRPEGVADPAVFPGYDENGDFISDFNQNSNGDRENFFPDYEEPFLRYGSDRPEFLFGIDLNNNGWVDRFENDDLPDYPYKKDHWGHNLYASVQVIPEVELTAGRLSQELHAANRQNRTLYGIFSFERDWPALGRLRLFEMVKKAEDNIPDELSQWLIPEPRFGQPGETSGRNQPVPDALAGEDTWINSLCGDWEYYSPRRWSTRHRFKWETWRQRDAEVELQRDAQGEVLLDAQGEPLVAFDPLGPEGRNGREVSGFFGLIDKADYLFSWRQLSFQPRVKSEWLSQTPFSRSLAKRRSWDGIFFFLVQFQLFRDSHIQLGFERRQFYELLADEKALAPGRPTGDFRGTALAFQLTNTRPYLGYSLTTQLGIRYDRRSLEVVGRQRESRTSGLAFLSVFAGL